MSEQLFDELNLPITSQKRVVIVGCGFAGLELTRRLKKSNYQVILLDKNNYHQFQPLLYQVATAGLEPRDISFPIRKIFQKNKNIFFRVAQALEVEPDKKIISTSIGTLPYDYLVLANGATTSFFGLGNIEKYAKPMKSVVESLELLNTLLHNFEDALVRKDELEPLMNIVIVGGGPTGVELSGALAEMKRYIFPKDYKELDCSKIRIVLVEASSRLLNSFSENSSKKAEKFLSELGVEVYTNTQVTDYDGEKILFSSIEPIRSNTLIWAAGIKVNLIKGIPASALTTGNRILVDQFNAIIGSRDIYVIGDAACLKTAKWPKGHPQVAQVAIQQARNLAGNLRKSGKPFKPFTYKDYGTMATIGRNKAVAELPFIKFQGLIAWYVWMFIHLRSIFGFKNKILIFINWAWSYLTYDQSLRITFLPKGWKLE